MDSRLGLLTATAMAVAPRSRWAKVMASETEPEAFHRNTATTFQPDHQPNR